MRSYRIAAVVLIALATGCDYSLADRIPGLSSGLSGPLANGDTPEDEETRRGVFADGFHCGESLVTFTGAESFIGEAPIVEPYTATYTFPKASVKRARSMDPSASTGESLLTIDRDGVEFAYGTTARMYRRVVFCVN